MTIKKSLTLMILTLAPALAQTMPAKPAETMMKAAPTFVFSAQAGMNMMMNSGGALTITAVPGEKLISRSVRGMTATLIYSGKNSASIFGFYDKALGAEGWKATMMDGKMMAADSVAKSAGTMTDSAMMMGGTHSATFEMGGHSIDLKVNEAGGRVTVAFRSK